MKILKVKRKTKRTHIKNKWSFGDWYENVTCIYLTFLGIKIKTLHRYFISYRGELCKL
jgi:hypothetical protein